MNDVLAPAGVQPRSIQEVTLTEAIIEVVKGGLGVALLARWAVAPQLASGSLAGLPLTERDTSVRIPKIDFVLGHYRRRSLSSRIPRR